MVRANSQCRVTVLGAFCLFWWSLTLKFQDLFFLICVHQIKCTSKDFIQRQSKSGLSKQDVHIKDNAEKRRERQHCRSAKFLCASISYLGQWPSIVSCTLIIMMHSWIPWAHYTGYHNYKYTFIQHCNQANSLQSGLGASVIASWSV